MHLMLASDEAVSHRYIEWTGHSAAGHPAYLDPAIMVMLAAFDATSRESEAARHQPNSMRRSPDAARQAARDEAENRGGAVAWLRSMLAFHERK